MRKDTLRGALLLLFVALISSSAFGQQRWFENGTSSGSYRRVQWEDVAVVVFYNPSSSAAVGARIYAIANGKLEPWGTVPKGSPSIPKLRALITAKKERWIKMQPSENGAYLQVNNGVGYVDMSRIVSATQATPIDFGQEVYILGVENSLGTGAVIDPAEKTRIEKMITDSLIP